ncbi:MAG TPA: pentapeptide MXKDX repeat protein [Gammaproteobacteria bacterium]
MRKANEILRTLAIAGLFVMAVPAQAGEMAKGDGMALQGQHDGMAKDGMSKDGMTKDGMTKDGMAKEGMTRDGMAKETMRDGSMDKQM